jgi:hypothetical protein
MFSPAAEAAPPMSKGAVDKAAACKNSRLFTFMPFRAPRSNDLLFRSISTIFLQSYFVIQLRPSLCKTPFGVREIAPAFNLPQS